MASFGWPVLTGLGIGAAAALVVGFAWGFARLYCRPNRRQSGKTPGESGLPFEEVAFPSDGQTLRGWFVPAKESRSASPAVVLAHSWSHEASQWLPLVSHLRASGFASLLYSARGHGESEGDGPITIVTFAEDLLAAARFLATRHDIDGDRLAAVGHSLGGSAAIVAASWEPRLKAVVSTAAFADPEELTAGFLSRLHLPRWPLLPLIRRFIEGWLGRSMAEVAPAERIARSSFPVMLIHGAADTFIPPSNMRILADRAGDGRAETWLAAGRGHSDILRHPDLGVRAVAFLREHV